MIANIDPTSAKSPAPIYQLKVTLLGTEPPVWRRLRVPGNAKLPWLHAVLQVVQFREDRRLARLGPPQADFDRHVVLGRRRADEPPRLTEAVRAALFNGGNGCAPS